MAESSRRAVSFVVVADGLSAAEIADGIGLMPDEASSGAPRFPREATWELHESGSADVDLSSLIESVVSRVEPCLPALESLRAANSSLSCFLRIVAYIGDDPVGPGFAIGSEAVAALARVGATVDADLYFAPA